MFEAVIPRPRAQPGPRPFTRRMPTTPWQKHPREICSTPAGEPAGQLAKCVFHVRPETTSTLACNFRNFISVGSKFIFVDSW
jgi:hypothetical protein